MDTRTPFKWRHFEAEIILLCVRWHLRYALSYHNLARRQDLPQSLINLLHKPIDVYSFLYG